MFAWLSTPSNKQSSICNPSLKRTSLLDLDISMCYLSTRRLAILYTFVFPLIVTSNAIPSHSGTKPLAFDSPDQGPSQQLPSHQFEYRNQINPVTTETSPYHPFDLDQSTKYPLAKRQRLTIGRFRVATMFLLWSGYRLGTDFNTIPGSQSEITLSLKKTYSEIRRAAINEWAKLPEQSYVRITCGQLIVIILPPADRTVPWTLVEEASYTLLLMTAAGLGGLVSGMYPAMIASTVVWYYLAVIMPGPEPQP